MEILKYVIEDQTIAELLGIQNFKNDESAILELVKNSYDAKATIITISFDKDSIIVTDDGDGMDSEEIKEYWMHIGKSNKGYETIDNMQKKRILSGSKGIGRFALARLGNQITVISHKKGCKPVEWKTDWSNSYLSYEVSYIEYGTQIFVSSLRERWSNSKINKLMNFLSRTYNDTSMKIFIKNRDEKTEVKRYFNNVNVGINCLSKILISYLSKTCQLNISVYSDEFTDEAQKYVESTSIKAYNSTINIIDDFSNNEFGLENKALKDCLVQLGDFSAELYFYIKPIKDDIEKFFYKYESVPEPIKTGVILYRNAFSITTYDGDRDWLELGKRSRKSPAAASHPTGAWRIRENQISGKVIIDKKENQYLMDLSNRQGLDENIYYSIFISIIQTGLKEFERYRQDIIRKINKKNYSDLSSAETPIANKIVRNPKLIFNLSSSEAIQLADEIKVFHKESQSRKKEQRQTEEQYIYDVRILNVLATSGLKASSIAHEMENDRNSIYSNCDNIINALKEYGLWEELCSEEKTTKIYKNIPYLLEQNRKVNKKIITFMDVMLTDVEQEQFFPSLHSLADIVNQIKNEWENDYSWITIKLDIDEDFCLYISEDIIKVIFDNLILNSIQQNENNSDLVIDIEFKGTNDTVFFCYCDNGVGLHPKYKNNPRKILEVHESSRKKGHGLGMWIVNNSVIMSNGEITKIEGNNGFNIEFYLKGKSNGKN